MSDHEHSDGELGEVPSATVATPSLSIGNVAGIRKDSYESRIVLYFPLGANLV